MMVRYFDYYRIVKIAPAAWLLVSGIGGLGALARRRKLGAPT
jgi:D-arabinose 1-dehydrogenase-like Zn-dependent alcohol dehydrogenase